MARGATRKFAATQGNVAVTLATRLMVFSRLAGVLLLVAGLSGLIGIGAWHMLSLPVNRVVVSGELQQVSRDQLMAVISDALDGGFLWTDLQAIREPIESLPWVHRAVVRRQWPDSIEVRVIEQRAIARWGESAFLNHAGDIFRPATAVADGLPLLAGPEGSEEVLMQQYRLVQERMHALGLHVQALRMNRRGGLRAELAGGGELVFGRGELESKLDRFQVVYRSQLLARRAVLKRVDLRYSKGAAVAWLPDVAVAAGQQAKIRERG